MTVMEELSRKAAAARDPRLVCELIAAAHARPNGIEMLMDAPADAVAIAFGVSAFTVDAARALLEAELVEA
jgi:hypothetical protein